MVKHTQAKVLPAAILKVAILCLLLFLQVSGSSWAQPVPYTPVAPLIEKLTDTDFRVRHDAADAIAKIGSPAVPFLINALKAENQQVRWRAASALADIGAEASAAVPTLLATLHDQDEYIRRIAAYALGKIGPEASTAVPELIEALQDSDRNLRLVAAYALGKIGSAASSATPALIVTLQDTNAEVRWNAAMALGRIGADADTVVPALIAALQDKAKHVRQGAADALGQFGAKAKTAVPALITALKDENKYVRLNAASALGRIGLEAKPAIPALIAALQDDKVEVRRNAANGLGGIAGVFQDKAKKLSNADLDKDISDLEKALKIVEDPEAKFPEEYIAVVRRPLLALQAEKQTRLFDRTLEWILKHKWWLGAITYIIFVPFIWLILLRVRPLWLLRINNALKPYTDVPLAVIGISVPIRYALFVGFFHYHPKVLDGWVASHLKSVREEFQQKDTVRDCASRTGKADRNVYIPVPVVLDGETIPQLTAQDLQPKFKKQRGCLLIWGEGGAGKTSLACQIATWATSDDQAERLCEHRMLPVLIEEELDFEATDKPPFIAAIRGQLQDLTNEADPISEELLERLLRQRRILVIVDHLSEMSEATRKAIRPELPDFCVNALVITSRTEETLGKVTKTTLKPLRIEGNRLSSFMEAYLTQRGKRDRFTDTEFFDACSRLSTMVGTRNITVLLAKLYAEQLIARQDGTASGTGTQGLTPLPDNIPDLMLSYLNELNRDVNTDKLDDRMIQEDAKALAWECLKGTYRPATAKRKDAVALLNGDDAEARLKYLEHRLRLIQTIGPAQDQIRFALDPLAEYLAALQLIENYGKNQGQWRKFLAQSATLPGAPVAIQGFLLAVHDCCLCQGAEVKVPDFVAQELKKQMGLASPPGQTQMAQRP